METENSNDQYVGTKKVIGTVKEDLKTPLGGEVFKVLYEDGTSELVSKTNFDLVVTSAPSDSSVMSEKKLNKLVVEVSKLVAEYDIQVLEIDRLLRMVASQLDNTFNRATNFLWTGVDGNYVPNTNVMMNRTYLEALRVIEGITSNKPSVHVEPEQIQNNS